jgi:hypothetical protein
MSSRGFHTTTADLIEQRARELAEHIAELDANESSIPRGGRLVGARNPHDRTEALRPQLARMRQVAGLERQRAAAAAR